MTRAHNGLPFYQARGLLGERLQRIELEQRNIPLSQAAGRTLLADFLKYQQRMWFVAEFMTKVDGATMYSALEARSPFLDQTLWDFGAALPPKVRFHKGKLKSILRELVRRRLSPAVASRSKQGFSIPVERWVLNRWRGLQEFVGDPWL